MPADEVHRGVFRSGDEGVLRAGATYEEVRFEGLTLVEADLREVAFLACAFDACDLTLADLRGATLRDVRFGDCRLRGVDLSELHDDALGVEARFERCDLDLLRADQLDLRNCVFAGGHARQAEFTRCDLRGVVFDGVDLHQARFQRCDLRKADLRSASGYRIDPSTNRIGALRVALPEAVSFLAMLDLDVEA